MGTIYYYVLVIKTGITSQSRPRSSVFPRFAGGKRSELRSVFFFFAWRATNQKKYGVIHDEELYTY